MICILFLDLVRFAINVSDKCSIKSTAEVRRFEHCLEFVEHREEETRKTRKQIARGKVKVNKKRVRH